MPQRKIVKYIVVLCSFLGLTPIVSAQTRMYKWELGLQGGCGYYVGDAAPHIFTNVREVYGGHVRYKFDKRWSLQLKGLHQVIRGTVPEDPAFVWSNKLINLDVVGEFNFFRLGLQEYDSRVKPITPYIFLGVGVGLYGMNYGTAAAYLPLGIGLKWKFAQRWQLQLAWQHNVYFADNLELVESLGNTYKLNGSNFLNNDLTGQLMLGIVFEFGKEKKICKWCLDQ
ncbi:MAG: hypothetical protein IJ920_01045 [Paludibacteraceae bacterium]|nr:hypothetical protein [Paludibacteraceae bacterium]